MRGKPLIPLALVGMLVLLPLVALFELPGEQELKAAVGYPTSSGRPTCGPILDRGSGEGWRTEPTQTPTVRDEASSARIASKIYLVAGIQPGEPTNRSTQAFESYDVKTGAWERLPALPRPLNHVNVAAWEGDVYVLGGKTDELTRGVTSPNAWRYDVDAREWDRLPALPTSRGSAATAVVDDRIYVIGGYNLNMPTDAVESFDPRTETWREHAPMPTPRDHVDAAVWDGEIYVFGGRQEEQVGLPTLERYSPERDAWKRLPDGPYAPAGFTFEATPEGLVAAGGENYRDLVLYGSVWSYDPEAGSWTRLPSMAPPKHGQGGAYANGRLWIVGGSTCSGFNPSRTVESIALPRS